MTAKSTNRRLTAIQSNESPSTGGQDGHKATQPDASGEQTNNPPNHGIPTFGPARFLWETSTETPIADLGERYQAWLDAKGGADDGE